jgi:DNA-directed RNA polymerase I, II, and III subunit RPABC4
MNSYTQGGVHHQTYDDNVEDEFARNAQADQAPKTTYICGNCGKDAKFDKDTGIRCVHCGHRIFYKKRERKPLQYDAR